MKFLLKFFLALTLLITKINSANAQSTSIHYSATVTVTETFKNSIFFNDSLPDYKKLKFQLHSQRKLKVWGWFNAVWGGAWFGTGTVLTLMSSENRLLGIVPATIGAGACILGVRRIKISNRKIENLKRQMTLGASPGGVAVVYEF